MLEIVNYNDGEYEFPCLIVLGCFDSLHIGHADLLKSAKLQAKINGLDLGIMVFSDGKGGDQVFTFEEKLKFFEEFNVKFILKVEYNDSFKKTRPLDFLHIIEDKINVKAYMSGKDFRFGEGAKGKSSTLKNYAEDEENGVWYLSVKDTVRNDEKVSTTQIKSLLENGNIKYANELLNREYFVTGTVVKGAGRGKSVVGFPTMNIEYPDNKVKIKQGVYSVKCDIDGKEYKGIANYGGRPTFDEETPVLEVYLTDFEGDYYGRQLTVRFVDNIRDIHKFDSAEDLSDQLNKDMIAANFKESE